MRANAWRTQLVVGVLGVGLTTVYALTLAPGATWGDGLEFAAAVHTLGIPHPTGYPLYILLGKLWELMLPIGSVAWSLSILSAACGVGAALCLFGAVREAMPEEEDWEDEPQPHHWRRILIPGGTAMAWGLTPITWQICNIAEVYALFALLFNALVWLMLRNLRTRKPWVDGLIAFLLGLALTHHRLIVLLLPAVTGYAVQRLRQMRRDRREGAARRPPPATLWVAGGFVWFLLGLAPILYLPLRAAQDPPINWGDPSTWENLLWVLRGGEYAHTRFLASEGIAWEPDQILPNVFARIQLALITLLGNFVPLMSRTPTFAALAAVTLLTIMAIGWWRSRPALRWSVPLTVALNLLAVGVYNIADFEAYLLPTICAAWFWIAFGLLWVAEAVEGLFLRRRFTYTPLVLGLLPLWLGVRFWDLCDRSQAERADLWARGILEHLEPGSLLLTRGDGDTYAMWYAQLVDGIRPDVTVFGSNFMWSGWYRDHFSGEEAQALHFEDTGHIPDARYFLNALVGGVIAPNLRAGRPVYACFNPYESPNALLLTIWEQALYGPHLKYSIELLSDQTRLVPRPEHRVGPPANPFLPAEWVQAMRSLGEPSSLLFRIVDNPALTELALQRFEEEVRPGYAAWQHEQRNLVFGSLFEMPIESFLRSAPP